MKYSLKSNISTATVIAALVSTVSAATLFTNNDAANSYITNAGNWDNGLPTGANQGTIDIDAGYFSDEALSGYDILHTNGQISRAAGLGALSLTNGTTWVSNGAGASFASSVRGVSVNSGSSFSLVNGTIATESGRDTTVQDASSILNISGGSYTVGRNLIIRTNGTYRISGGSLSATALGSVGFASNGTMEFNGGSTTADRFVFKSGTTATFGGSNAGSAVFGDWGSGLYTSSNDRQEDDQISINFISGTNMVLTLDNTARGLDFTRDATDNPLLRSWAQALWEEDQLFYNGFSATELSLSWEDATTTGFGDGSYFSFTGAGTYGGSLSLAAIPEPSHTLLLGFGMIALAGYRRRHP